MGIIGKESKMILGQATLVIQDHDEATPRIIKCEIEPCEHPDKVMERVIDGLTIAGLIGLALGSGGSDFMHMPLIMGAITSAVCTSFKAELGTATHNFTTGQHTVRTALYTSTATLGASTTAYSSTNEITGTGYTAAGVAIANVTPTTSGTTAIYDWADAQWTTATFTANGALVYNDTAAGNNALFVIAFGGDQSVTAGTFTIQWPAADASNAIFRIA